MDWIIAIPLVGELLWLATYLPRWRRWRVVRAQVERKQARPVHPVDDLDLVCATASIVMAREGRAAVVVADINWSGRYFLYHLPVITFLQIFGPTPNLLMGFRPRVALTMVLTASAYIGLCYLAVRQFA